VCGGGGGAGGKKCFGILKILALLGYFLWQKAGVCVLGWRCPADFSP